MLSVPLDSADTPATDPTLWDQISSIALAVGTKLMWIAVIIVVCVLIAWVLRFLIRRLVDRIVSGAKSKANVDDTRAIDSSPLAQVRVVQRTRTLGTILQNIFGVAIAIVAGVLIVWQINPDILGSLTLLTAAVGAGLGFGAQNIVKDVLNGIFIVAEDQIGIGDVVDVGLATGVVEYVSVRITQVRDVNGTLWYVRNGEILRIGNMSMGWSRVIVDVTVPADADLASIESELLETARELSKDPKWRTRIIERPELWGLESVAGDTLVTRLVMKTRANARDDVARELRMRLKARMSELGVTLPQLSTVELVGSDAARRVRGANPPKTRPTPITPPPPERPSWRVKKPKQPPTAPDGSPGSGPS